MIWITIAYFVIAFAMLGAVYAGDVVEGEYVEPLTWPARIVIALLWPLFLVWFVIDLVKGETDEESE